MRPLQRSPLSSGTAGWSDICIAIVLCALVGVSGAILGGVGEFLAAVTPSLALLAALVLILRSMREGNLPAADPVVRLPLLLFLGAALLSSIFSPHPWAAREEFFRLASVSLVYFTVAGAFAGKRVLMRFPLLVTSWGLLLCLYGIWRGGQLSLLEPLTSTFVNRNHFADYLAIILPFPFVMALVGKCSLKWVVWGCASFLILISLGLTLSRGGIAAALVSLLVVLLLVMSIRPSGKRPIRIGAMLLLFLLLLSQAGIGVFLRSFSPAHIHELSWQTRVSVWGSTLGMIAEHPFLGWGLGSFASLFPLFQKPSVWYSVNFAHSEPLQVLAETGVLGLALVVWAWLSYVRGILGGIRSGRDLRLQRIMVAVLASLLAASFHALFDFSLHIPANAYLTAVILGVGVCALGEPGARRPSRGGGLWVIPLLFLCVCVGLPFQVRSALGRLAYERGCALREGEKWEEALPYFQRAASLDPSNDIYRTALGHLFVRRFRSSDEKVAAFRLAEREFEAAARHCPGASASRSLLSLGLLYAEVGDRERAALYIGRALEAAPSDPFLPPAVGMGYLEIGMEEEALEVFRSSNENYPPVFQENMKALFGALDDPSLIGRAVPDDPDRLAGYAYLLAARRHWEESRQAFERALHLDPENESALLGMARVHEERGEKDAAIELRERVVFLSPENLRAHLALGDAYFGLGRYDRALREYEICRGLKPDGILYYRKCASACRAIDGEKAELSFWEDCVAENPTWPALRMELAKHCAARGLWEEAFRNARRAAALSPEPYPFLVYLAGLYEKGGLAGEAASCWREALSLKPDDTRARENIQRLQEEPGAP